MGSAMCCCCAFCWWGGFLFQKQKENAQHIIKTKWKWSRLYHDHTAVRHIDSSLYIVMVVCGCYFNVGGTTAEADVDRLIVATGSYTYDDTRRRWKCHLVFLMSGFFFNPLLYALSANVTWPVGWIQRLFASASEKMIHILHPCLSYKTLHSHKVYTGCRCRNHYDCPQVYIYIQSVQRHL